MSRLALCRAAGRAHSPRETQWWHFWKGTEVWVVYPGYGMSGLVLQGAVGMGTAPPGPLPLCPTNFPSSRDHLYRFGVAICPHLWPFSETEGTGWDRQAGVRCKGVNLWGPSTPAGGGALRNSPLPFTDWHIKLRGRPSEPWL